MLMKNECTKGSKICNLLKFDRYFSPGSSTLAPRERLPLDTPVLLANESNIDYSYRGVI